MSPVGTPSRTRRDQRRRSQQQHHPPPQDNALPTAIAEHDESLVDDDNYSAPNPLAFTPGLFDSLDALNNLDESTLDQFKADLGHRDSHSPPGEGQTRSTVSPDPSGAPFGQRRRSSERDNVLHDTNSPNAFGEVPSASNASRPMPSATTALPDGGSESITIVHPPPGHPSPSLSGAAGPSNAFDVSFNGPPPPSQFNFANTAHAQQQQKWMQSAQASDPSTSTPFDPSHVINFDPSMLPSTSASGSSPFPDAQLQHQRQMIRGAVIQGMQSRTQSQGPLHISTPNGNNLATTTLQTHPGLSVSPSYPPEFTFPANRDSGGVHAAADGTTIMSGIPPSASSPSPSPSFSSSSVSTPVYNGPNPNFIQSGNAPGGSSAAPPPPPALHHPNPHKVSQSSLRSSSRPSPTPESGPSRESGHPYPSANRHGHGGRSRRHPSDPNQQQSAQQHGGVAPDLAVYAQRRTSCGPVPMQTRMTARRPGMSPPNGPAVARPRYEQEALMAAGATVRVVDPSTGQPIQFANVQQWAHGVQPPQGDQSLNSPPSSGAEYSRSVNRASSSASLTPSSESSLAGWNSTDDLHRFGQQGMEIQSPVGDMEVWPQWTTMSGEPSMLQQSLNGGFDPSLAGPQDGTQYSPTVGGMVEHAFFQEGLVLNGQSQSPKQFGQVNGIAVSPGSGIQTQPPAWGPHAVPASMGLQH